MHYKNSLLIFKENRIIEIACDKKTYLTENLIAGSKDDNVGFIKVDSKDQKIVLSINDEEVKLAPGERYKLQGYENTEVEYLINNKIYLLKDNDDFISIGNAEDSDICIRTNKNFKMRLEKNKLYKFEEFNIYKNGLLCLDNPIFLDEGDLLFVDKVKLTYYNDSLLLEGFEGSYKTSLNTMSFQENTYEEFPQYKRSPRIIKNMPTDTIELKKAPSKAERAKGQLARLLVPPIVMTLLTVIISIVQPRGIYIILSIAGTTMSSVFSLTSYISDKKEIIRKNALREKVYSQYLLDMRKKLNELRESQIKAIQYNNPSLKEIEKMVTKYSSRIYERINTDNDFLNICIGNGELEPKYKINSSNDSIELEKDKLEEEADNIVKEFNKINNVPISINLKNGHLGIVGEKKYIHEQLNLIFAQLTFFHSYHDLEIIVIYDEKDKEEFDWLRWYKHFKISAINVSGLIDSERAIEQVLGHVAKILKSRELKYKEDEKKNIFFSPHYLFVVDEQNLIINHPILEYLQRKDSKLNMSVIYTSQFQASLPENVRTIFKIENYEDGKLVINEGMLLNKKIKLNHIDIKLSDLSRTLSPLKHVKGMKNVIPNNITFFELYKVKDPKELKIKTRWDINEAHKTLAVPLGVRASEDYVYLNLHEKAHGPHGLVAGTTGSGKSEIIQSYILSLAVNFHPYEVGFLLIDYKGGGMAGLFEKLPHLLGTITNLDGSESMRAMASIKSELARRQQIFNQYKVNHINQYSKLFKAGKAEEALPHLFLISDEFAELKKEQPDFMSELVSAARIGRSLGIHLILATQKPSGVVDDQIWSNSKFKLALKVQNESDSNEILKTPDAAKITQPGRAYLQVGNNEIYELFQSAWSGASVKEEEEEKIDNRVYLINSMGQGEILNKDLSETEEESNNKHTELDVTVKYIQKLFNDLKLPKVRRPWLPPLKNKIVSPYIKEENVIDVNDFEKADLNVSIGLIDKPEMQSQVEYKLDFLNDGNLSIFASSGFGKTTSLITILLSLAIKNSPKLLQFFILDFGNSGLISMQKLPHVRDYIKFDDNIKFNKFCKIIDSEIKERKLLLGQAGVANFYMYNEMNEEKLPALFIVIDNYDAIRELNIEAEDFILRMTRDGVSIGIFTIIAPSRQNAVKYAVLNNFKNKFAHYIFDETELKSLIGRSDYRLSDIPGRALVKDDIVNIMQVYTAVEFEHEIEYVKKIGNIVKKIDQLYTGERPEGIRMLPDILNVQKLKEFSKNDKYKKKIPIGLDFEDVKTQYIELNGGIRLIIGSPQSGKTNLLKILLELKESINTYIIDSANAELYVYKEYVNGYAAGQEEIVLLLNNIKEIIDKRKAEFEQIKKTKEGVIPKVYYSSLEDIIVIIDGCDEFINNAALIKEINVKGLIEEAITVGITFILTAQSNSLKGYDELTKLFKSAIHAVILGNPNEQNIINAYVKKPKLDIDVGYNYEKGNIREIKIPKATS